MSVKGKPTPHHKVTEITRAKVISLRSFGINHEDIAKHLEISPDTLTTHYRRELDTAITDANEAMAKSLYKNGMNGDTTAQIFWLKTRARWRTEDSKNILDSNEALTQEMRELRAELDKKNKRDY